MRTTRTGLTKKNQEGGQQHEEREKGRKEGLLCLTCVVLPGGHISWAVGWRSQDGEAVEGKEWKPQAVQALQLTTPLFLANNSLPSSTFPSGNSTLQTWVVTSINDVITQQLYLLQYKVPGCNFEIWTLWSSNFINVYSGNQLFKVYKIFWVTCLQGISLTRYK